MGNEEFERKQDLDQEKQPESSKSSNSEPSSGVSLPVPTSSPVTNHSKEIQNLHNKLQQLQDQLTYYQIESSEKEKRIAEEFAGMKALLNEKTQALETANTELGEKNQTISIMKTEFISQNEKVSNLEEKLKLVKNEFREKILEKTEQTINLEVELKETKNLLTTAEEKSQVAKIANESLQLEKEAYLTQIERLHIVIQQTEEEIKEIEETHLEVQDQLKNEIDRTEERAGQMREDLKRETRGTLARDRHIRVVLQQSELGRILLYLVDYFENTKKKTLALETMSTEVGVPRIICRTHLRHLHELAVCDFNEVSREVRLIRKAK
ncbi:MAG: hypothetical protein ACXADY_20290 [Candidatus Hodarchaeales archaeon]|jgi:DNA repair exonuclease SbcCD ATPase subunit